MPIKLACGGCNAVLNAPDSAAGKRVKCPKCGVLLIIPTPEPEPEFEMVEEEPAPAPAPKRRPAVILDDTDDEEAKPTKRKSKAVEDDDDDDEPKKTKRRRRDEDDDEEDDETPRRKRGKGKKEKPKGKLLLILGIVFGVSLLLGIVGTVIGLMMGGSGTSKGNLPTGTGVPAPTLPAGWKEFKEPEFEMWVPSEGSEIKDMVPEIPANSPQRRLIPAGGKIFTKEAANPTRGLLLFVLPMSPEQVQKVSATPDQFLDGAIALYAAAGATRPDTIDSKAPASLGGVAGRGATLNTPEGKIFARAVIAQSRTYILIAGGKNLNENSEHVKTIFDNFKIKP